MTKKFENGAIGEELQRLAGLPPAEQPYISISTEEDGHPSIYEGLKVVPTGTAVMFGGTKIKLCTTMTGHIYFFYWAAEGQELWGHEEPIILKLEVC